MIETFSRSMFARRLEQVFRVRLTETDTIDLELSETTDLNAPRTTPAGHSPEPRGEAFSLVFKGPAEAPLPQGTYLFEHAELGDFPLFIVPIRADAQGILYEAIFNRLVSTP